MNDIKEQALSKMLDEMLEISGGTTEEKIHNWLCDQDDIELSKGIMKEGKSIIGSANYCKTQAQKEAEDGMAMIDDPIVFGWLRDYFIKVEAQKPKSKNEKKTNPKKELSLDDLI